MNHKKNMLILSITIWVIFIGFPTYSEILTVDEVLKLALKNNSQLKSQSLGVEVAIMDKNSARALWGPRFIVNLNGLYFSEKAKMDLKLNTTQPQFPLPTQEEIATWDQGDLTLLQYLQRGFGSLLNSFIPSGPMEIGEQYQLTLQLLLAQPLTKLYSIYHLNKMKDLGIDIAKIQLKQREVELAYQVRSNYYKLLILVHSKEALESTLNLVEAQLKQVTLAKEVGLLKQGDLLRGELGKAQITQALISVERGIKLVKDTLKAIINLPTLKEIEPVEVEIPQFNLSLEDCLKKSKTNRPEFIELDLSIRQLEHGLKIAIQDFLPDVNLVAQYQHVEGSGIEQPDFAVGGTLSWTIWAWGESYYNYNKLKEKLRQMRELKKYVENMIELEVKGAFEEMRTKSEEIKVSELAIKSAEESLRVEEARYNSGEITNTELLMAISNLAQARLNFITAKYGYLEGLAKLKKVMGEI